MWRKIEKISRNRGYIAQNVRFRCRMVQNNRIEYDCVHMDHILHNFWTGSYFIRPFSKKNIKCIKYLEML